MKNLLALICAALALSSCDSITGSGNIVTEKRNTGNFTAISASSGFEVEVKIGEATSVTIEADDNVIEHVKASVNNGVLTLGLNHLNNVSNVHLKAFIVVPSLSKLNASSGADIVVKDQITADGKVSFHASSSGSINAKVDAPDVDGDASSSGDITLSGTTKNINFEASSSGEIKAKSLLSETAVAKASSSGEIAVNISVSLDAHASSSGSIKYTGSGSVNKVISSGGDINKE